jgi:uncharacterized protein YehS (DUF1456 family)
LTNNDVLRSVRYTLDLSEPALVEIFKLAGHDIERDDVAHFLKKEDEEGYVECSDEAMTHFLNGFVTYKRGKSEHSPEQDSAQKVRLTNNVILKKLRVAFELKEDDMHAILAQASFPVSKPELSALFRKPGHKNYRPCGDQLLRNFLKGLSIRFRG